MATTTYIDGKPQPLKYRVLLNQVGTAAPTESFQLENTLGVNATYTYEAAGSYKVVFPAGTLPFGRTFFDMKFVDPSMIIDWHTYGEALLIFCSTNQNDLLFDCPLEIEVYPPTI